jgi:hypothetical protein
MKVIIAGSRNINIPGPVGRAIEASKLNIKEIIIGNARGVDTLAENYAGRKELPVKLFPAEYDKYGKPAGAIRNQQMAEYADALIVIWDGQSSGTKSLIKMMNKLNKPVHLYLVDNND